MYKGQIEGFPQEIVEAMLDEQVRQGNKRDVTVFEHDRTSGRSRRGFTWSLSADGQTFWLRVIENKRFDIFFDKYPKKTAEYPKVMLVSDYPISKNNPGVKRVVFMKKNGRYLA